MITKVASRRRQITHHNSLRIRRGFTDGVTYISFQLSDDAAVGLSKSFTALPVNAMGKFFVTYSVASILLTIGVVSYAWQTRSTIHCDFMYFEVFGSGFVQPTICLTMITFKTVTSIFYNPGC